MGAKNRQQTNTSILFLFFSYGSCRNTKMALESRTTKAHFLAADKEKKVTFLNVRLYPRFFVALKRLILMVEILDSWRPLFPPMEIFASLRLLWNKIKLVYSPRTKRCMLDIKLWNCICQMEKYFFTFPQVIYCNCLDLCNSCLSSHIERKKW